MQNTEGQKSPFLREMTRLDRTIDELLKLSDALRTRLDGLCCPSVTTVGRIAEDKAVQPSPSGVVAHLAAAADQLGAVRMDVSDLLTRLDL
jgi:hypothetical protein